MWLIQQFSEALSPTVGVFFETYIRFNQHGVYLRLVSSVLLITAVGYFVRADTKEV